MSNNSVPAQRLIDTYPVLKLLKDKGGRSEMLSRGYLLEHGIDEETINEARRRGEVVVSGSTTLSTVGLTLEGEEAMNRAMEHFPEAPAAGPRM